VNREVHAQICGSPGVRSPGPPGRSRPAEGGSKPPTTALAEDRCGERSGKSRDSIPAGVSRRDERRSKPDLCRLKRRNGVRRHQNQSLCSALGRVQGKSAYRLGGVRRKGSMNPTSGSRTEHVNARAKPTPGDRRREGGSRAAESARDRVPVAPRAGGPARSSREPPAYRSGAGSEGAGPSRPPNAINREEGIA
jgi:hypothetical protein